MFTLSSDKDQRKEFAFAQCKWTLINSVYLSLLYGSVCGPCVSFRTVVHRVLVHSRFQQVVQHPANMSPSYTEINEVLMG